MILRILSIAFPPVRKLMAKCSEYFETLGRLQENFLSETEESAQLKIQLKDSERNLQMMTEARLNSDRSHEFLRGEVEILKAAHASEIDGLKRIIDFFAPAVAGRTIFGLAPEIKYDVNEPRMQPQGARTRRTTNAEALDNFMREYEKMAQNGEGLPPNPNGDPPADFTSKQ